MWPCMGRYGKFLRAKQKTGRRKLARSLGKLHIKKIKSRLYKGWKPCLATLQKASSVSGEDLEKAWDHLRGLRAKCQRRIETLDVGNPGSLHRLRVAIKHLRYALEFLQPVPNLKEEAALHQLTAWQMQLGRVQDLRVLVDDLNDWLLDQRNSVRMVFKNPCRELTRRLSSRALHVAGKISRTPLRWTDDSRLSREETARGDGGNQRSRLRSKPVVNPRSKEAAMTVKPA